MAVRRSPLAGSWYPGTAAECEREIRRFLETAPVADEAARPPVGGVVPHAGWHFSGELACHVIHRLAAARPVDAVAVFGMHLHSRSPFYTMTEGEWETPFGNLAVAEGLAAELTRDFDFRIETADHVAPDNTIELQLPFIKYFFPDAGLLPVGVPPVENAIAVGAAVAAAARRLGVRLAVLGSTDLTHYGVNYGYAPKGSGKVAFDWVRRENDRDVIEAMTAMDPAKVLEEARRHRNACCAGAAAAAIAGARGLGAAKARTLAYANSYQKNPGDSFVGYVGIVFER